MAKGEQNNYNEHNFKHDFIGKKIILSGYYGFGNAGDEAVLAALCQIFRLHFPRAELVALSARPEQTAAAYGILAIDRWDKRALRRELAGAELFCSGGGSLFQDVTSVRSVWYYTSLLREAQKLGVPTIVLAQGLGPLRSRLGRWLVRRTLGQCALLSWRDQGAYDLAAAIGLGQRRNFLVCDPVLLWRPEKPDKNNDEKNVDIYNKEEKNNAEKKIGLALRPWPGLKPEAAARLAVLLREMGYTPVLLPFYQGEDEAGEDQKLAVEINKALAALNNEPLAILACHNPWEARAAVGSLRLLLGMRLHSLIMAAAQGVPALAVDYDPKVRDFAAALSIPQAAGGVSFRPEQAAAQLARLDQAGIDYDLAEPVGRWDEFLAAVAELL